MEIITVGTVISSDEVRIKDDLSKIVGSPVLVSVEVAKNKTTANQKAYYWGVLIPHAIAYIKDTYGEVHDKETIHALHLKTIWGNGVVQEEVMGELVIVSRSKSIRTMKKAELSMLIEKSLAFWAARGLFIPDPHENA